MSEVINLGTVDSTELRRVFDALMMLRVEDEAVTDVTVYCHAGHRRWHLSTDELTIVIYGEAASFSGAYRLPLTIVANAGRHSVAAGDVIFSVCNDTVTAVSNLGEQTLPCTAVPMPLTQRAAITRARASATLGGRELSYVVFSGAHPPFEVAMGEDEGDKKFPDHFVISVEPGRLCVTSNWTGAKLYEMKASTAAETRGSGRVKVDPDFLAVIFSLIDNDSTWKLSFDPKQSRQLVLESDTHLIIASMTLVPVLRLHERVVKLLERESFEFQTAANGVIAVRHEGVAVSLDFFQRQGDDLPLIKMSTVVTEHANESPELLREINDHNKSGAIARMWFDAGNVYCGLDMQSESLQPFPERLRHLATEAKRLRGLLEPFAAEAAMAPKRRRRTKLAKRQPEVWDEPPR